MTAVATTRVYVGSVEDVKARGCVQVSGGGHGIAVSAPESMAESLEEIGDVQGFLGGERREMDLGVT